MKKQNTNTTMKTNDDDKVKKERRNRLFFLYVEGKGFIHLDKEVGAMPNFTDGELLSFPSKSGAKYAREFFINLKLAEKIDIMAKVA
jgi:hypothetical protein